MAVNEKPVFATGFVSHGRTLFRPGEQLNGRVAPEVVRHAMEGGVASDSSTAATAARQAETERVADVNRQIETRSEKRDFNPREDRRR